MEEMLSWLLLALCHQSSHSGVNNKGIILFYVQLDPNPIDGIAGHRVVLIDSDPVYIHRECCNICVVLVTG